MSQTRNGLELAVCLALAGIGAAALCSVNLAEQSASPFLLAQERALGGVDFSTFPMLYAILLIACCLINILLLLKKGISGIKDSTTLARRRHICLLTVLTAIFTVLYTLFLPHVPFALDTAVFLFVMFHLYGQRHLLKNLAVSLSCSALFWFIFIKLSHLNI